MIVLLAVSILMATPPAETPNREDRRREVADVLKLGLSDRPVDRKAFLTTLSSPGALWKRVAAIHSLRDVHKPKALPIIRRLAKHHDVAIRIPALIQWVRWEFNPASLRDLTNQRGLGASLRSAFQTGEVKGRPLYRAEAATFFREGLAHSSRYARLDAAMGCVEMMLEPLRSKGLRVLKESLADKDAAIRLLAVRYLSVQYREPAFGPLLKTASQDTDPAVRETALRLSKGR